MLTVCAPLLECHHWFPSDWLSLLCREVKLWLLHKLKTPVCASMCSCLLHDIHWLFTGASQLWLITHSHSDSGQASSYWWCKCTYWELCVCFSTGSESSDDCLCEVIWFSQGPAVISCQHWLCHRGQHSNADEHSSAVHRGGSYCCKHAFRLWITDMSLIYTRSMWSCLSDLRRIRRMCLPLLLITIWIRRSATLLLMMRLQMWMTTMCKELSLSLSRHIEVCLPNFWKHLALHNFWNWLQLLLFEYTFLFY